MSMTKMGDLLRRSGRLTAHDVEEILAEQSATRRRFGEIAVEMGLCQPQDVWSAWCAQLSISPQHVDLTETGVDARALSSVSAGVARDYAVLPVRMVGKDLVLATTREAYLRAQAELPEVLDRDLKFVTTDSESLACALDSYYPRPLAAAS